MNLKKSLAAAAIGTGVVLSATACNPGGGYYPQAEYCVDQVGHVMPSYYCQPSYGGYGSYFVYMGSLHGHSYHTGQLIPRSYISGGREIRANNTSARAKAGIPVSTSFSNGSKASTPAKAQTPPGVSSTTSTRPSTTNRTTTTRTTSGFSSSTRSTFGGSSTRSSGGGFSSSRSSSGGRK